MSDVGFSWKQEKPRKMERWTKKNRQIDIVMSKKIFFNINLFQVRNVTKIYFSIKDLP